MTTATDRLPESTDRAAQLAHDLAEIDAAFAKKPDPGGQPVGRAEFDATIQALCGTVEDELAEREAKSRAAVESFVREYVAEYVEEHIEDLIGEAFAKATAQATAAASEAVTDRLANIRTEFKAEASACRKSLNDFKKSHADDLDRFDRLFADTLAAVKNMIAKQAPPNVIVNVPQQEPPTIVLPTDAIRVEVKPQLIVQPQPKITSTKRITYGTDGRPSEITEVT